MSKDLALDAIREAVELTEDERGALIAASLADPPRGAPLRIGDDEGGYELEPGAWRNEPCAFTTGLPPACPVLPLGSEGETFYFLNTLGQVHVLTASSSGKGPIDALFQGRGKYLEWAWPRWQAGRGGEGPNVKGYEADECRRDLFAACAFKGTFELEDRVRGRGAWRNDDGSLIYHAGDAVLIDGEWRPPGEQGRFIYPARPRLGRPAKRFEPEGPGSPGDSLLEVLRTFNWERGELDARLCLGWFMTAKVGGALERRPVAFVNGEEGSGKSTLQQLLRLGMNHALVSTSNTTQAGIYQRIQQDSIAIMVDEMEAKDDTRVVDKILELARIAYSGDKMQRGGKDGVGKEFALMSSFLGSSIAKPATDAQDDSRMAVLMLRPRIVGDKQMAPGDVDAKTIASWSADVAGDSPINAADVETWGRQLLRRWIDLWPTWPKLLRVFRHALMAAGHDDRAVDTFGPLAAACHLALHDGLPAPAELHEWMEWLKASELTETATKEKTWRRCFMHLLQAQPDHLKHEGDKSVGASLEAFRDAKDGLQVDQVNNRLARTGLALSWARDTPMVWETARLFVPAKHPVLHSLFQGTPWAGRLGAPGPWLPVLRQMSPDLWTAGKCEKGLDRKASGIFIHLAAALAA